MINRDSRPVRHAVDVVAHRRPAAWVRLGLVGVIIAAIVVAVALRHSRPSDAQFARAVTTPFPQVDGLGGSALCNFTDGTSLWVARIPKGQGSFVARSEGSTESQCAILTPTFEVVSTIAELRAHLDLSQFLTTHHGALHGHGC
jgi:hypothetical protein